MLALWWWIINNEELNTHLNLVTQRGKQQLYYRNYKFMYGLIWFTANRIIISWQILSYCTSHSSVYKCSDHLFTVSLSMRIPVRCWFTILIWLPVKCSDLDSCSLVIVYSSLFLPLCHFLVSFLIHMCGYDKYGT